MRRLAVDPAVCSSGPHLPHEIPLQVAQVQVGDEPGGEEQHPTCGSLDGWVQEHLLPQPKPTHWQTGESFIIQGVPRLIADVDFELQTNGRR